jgi:hypothetical protein
LCLHGYRQMSGAGLFAAALLFLAGGAAVWSRWHARAHGQPLVIAEFFMFLVAVGSFQFGLAAQGLVSGGIRTTELDGIAPTSLYTLLLAPTGELIYRSERPGRFMSEVVSRALIGLGFAFALPLLALAWRLNHG